MRKNPCPCLICYPARLIVLLVFIALPSPSWAQSPSPFWTGDAGRGTRVTVAEPTGTGLSPQEESLLPLVQSTIIGAFQRFSDMTVFDRQNLENILREQKLVLDGYFSDDDFIRIGQLTQARLVVFGSIHRIAGNYMLELAVTDVQTGERRASYPPRQVSLFALQDLSAIREAAANLLGQLGVSLTERGLQELTRTEDAARIQAENELARGIAAQRQGMVAEAFAYYFRAAAFNPALGEAVSRVSVMSAGVSTGNLGQDIRNRMHEYDSWRAILDAASSFYSDHLPYELEYNVIPRKHGINFARRTTDLSIEISLAPTAAWNTINDLREGFRIASMDEWNHIPLPTRQIVVPQQIGIVMQILNENGVVLSEASYTFSNLNETDRISRELFFRSVNTDYITNQFIIRVESVNGIPMERARETGLIQITSTDQAWRIDIDRGAEEREARRLARRTRRQARGLNSSRNTVEFFLFHAWEGGGRPVSGMGIGVGGYVSPAPNFALGLEGRFGDLDPPDGYVWRYVSFAPALGAGLPLGNRGWIFVNALLEMGMFGYMYGVIADWATPSFEAGLEFLGPFEFFGPIFGADNSVLNIKYRWTWFQGSYVHGISIGWGVRMIPRTR